MKKNPKKNKDEQVLLSLGIPRAFGSSLESQVESFLECFANVREATKQSPLYAKHTDFISKLISFHNTKHITRT